MIVVDTSAIMCIALGEPDAVKVKAAMTAASHRLMSAGTLAELQVVNAGRRTLADLHSRLQTIDVTIVPVDAAQADLIGHIYAQYGKGLHRASLNFGDCFAYALAKSRDLPLLYVGQDFALTDIRSALA